MEKLAVKIKRIGSNLSTISYKKIENKMTPSLSAAAVEIRYAADKLELWSLFKLSDSSGPKSV